MGPGIHFIYSIALATWCIFEPLHVYEPGFKTDKYSMYNYIRDSYIISVNYM